MEERGERRGGRERVRDQKTWERETDDHLSGTVAGGTVNVGSVVTEKGTP